MSQSLLHLHRRLVWLTLFITFIVIVLGAFTRLVDAGLGCPDWPGCFGFLHIPVSAEHIALANEAFPNQPYEFEKAWPEMVHRYVAGTLGLFILLIFIVALKRGKTEANVPVKLCGALLILVIFQATLGALTVTMKLHPLIVMGHLLGGFATFSLLAVLQVKLYQSDHLMISVPHKKVLLVFKIAIAVIVFQIALGGWTSANYAALVCSEFPVCQGDWWARADFMQGFQLWGHNAETYQYGVLSTDAMTAIHVSHRFGAVLSSLMIIFLLMTLAKYKNQDGIVKMMLVIMVLFCTQILLGISNIIFHLRLDIAVSHNAVAALLLVSLVSAYSMLKVNNE